MAYDLQEQEQIDQLRAWWAKYGTAVLTALVIAMVILGGWRGWQWYQGHQAAQARGYFEALEDASHQQGDESVARINAAIKTLRDEYATTDYAARGALVAASALQARDDQVAARAQLEWLVKTNHPALTPVARLRLAGVEGGVDVDQLREGVGERRERAQVLREDDPALGHFCFSHVSIAACVAASIVAGSRPGPALRAASQRCRASTASPHAARYSNGRLARRSSSLVVARSVGDFPQIPTRRTSPQVSW